VSNPTQELENPQHLNLAPAKWLWYPSRRCLPNTFILFRKEINLKARPVSATGWIYVDSRYCLYINGKRIQWGPGPCDPRYIEADPLDLAHALVAGDNVIGVQALHFGHGDGTWPTGKPGFIFRLEIKDDDGKVIQIVSNCEWHSQIARAWRPGQYKRWFLRSLQEEFDARLYPYGWDTLGYREDNNWHNAMELNRCPADKPPLCSRYPDHLNLISAYITQERCTISPRITPVLRSEKMPADLAESFYVQWNISPEEYFECIPPDSYVVNSNSCAEKGNDTSWKVKMRDGYGAVLTFKLKEGSAGWPYFTITASAGTVVELMVLEGHEEGNLRLLNHYFNSWTRFICREGINHFQTFDWEGLRWIQLHIHNAEKDVTIENVGNCRRLYNWANKPLVSCSDPELQRLFQANFNTLNNNAQDNLVPDVSRERQQVAGEGYPVPVILLGMGEKKLIRHFIDSLSQGATPEGYFMQYWPACSPLLQAGQLLVEVTPWGILHDLFYLFLFDCWTYYQYTGDLNALTNVYPRLVKAAHYFKQIQKKDDSLDPGSKVWIDHYGFSDRQHNLVLRNKLCAFNLLISGALKDYLSPLCEAFGKSEDKQFAETFAQDILQVTISRFWSKKHKTFVDNLPWIKEDDYLSQHDRTLATSILHDLCPDNIIAESVDVLAEPPFEKWPSARGWSVTAADRNPSFPPNTIYRQLALAKAGRADVVLNDLRTRFATMNSVIINNTIGELWQLKPDSEADEWSHDSCAPLASLYMGIVGIKPLTPGFGRCEIRPQLHDLEELRLRAYVPQGHIDFVSEGKAGKRQISITLPEGCEGELIVKAEENLDLTTVKRVVPEGCVCYSLPQGRITNVLLKKT